MSKEFYQNQIIKDLFEDYVKENILLNESDYWKNFNRNKIHTFIKNFMFFIKAKKYIPELTQENIDILSFKELNDFLGIEKDYIYVQNYLDDHWFVLLKNNEINLVFIFAYDVCQNSLIFQEQLYLEDFLKRFAQLNNLEMFSKQLEQIQNEFHYINKTDLVEVQNKIKEFILSKKIDFKDYFLIKHQKKLKNPTKQMYLDKFNYVYLNFDEAIKTLNNQKGLNESIECIFSELEEQYSYYSPKYKEYLLLKIAFLPCFFIKEKDSKEIVEKYKINFFIKNMNTLIEE